MGVILGFAFIYLMVHHSIVVGSRIVIDYRYAKAQKRAAKENAS